VHDATQTPEWQPAGFPGADEFARLLAGLQLDELQAALRVLQLRLGTEEERPGDFERSRMLAHEINNRVTRDNLRRGLERLGDFSGASAS
jgi:hypothetical protein